MRLAGWRALCPVRRGGARGMGVSLLWNPTRGDWPRLRLRLPHF